MTADLTDIKQIINSMNHSVEKFDKSDELSFNSLKDTNYQNSHEKKIIWIDLNVLMKLNQ